jgi:hypothetical protein
MCKLWDEFPTTTHSGAGILFNASVPWFELEWVKSGHKGGRICTVINKIHFHLIQHQSTDQS